MRIRSKVRLAGGHIGRDNFRLGNSAPGDAVLSTAPLRVCLIDADNSGGR